MLDGHCVGQGAALALAHTRLPQPAATLPVGRHLRVATNRTVLSLTHAHFLGLFPGMGLSFFLSRLKGNVRTTPPPLAPTFSLCAPAGLSPRPERRPSPRGPDRAPPPARPPPA